MEDGEYKAMSSPTYNEQTFFLLFLKLYLVKYVCHKLITLPALIKWSPT